MTYILSFNHHSIVFELFYSPYTLNEERIFIIGHLRMYPVVRSTINPPPAPTDESVLTSRGDRLAKFCIFTYREFEIGAKAALAALTNDISTTTAASPGFILLDIGAILSRAKTVYSANVVFANVRATKYVTRTYIPLASAER